MFDTHSIYYTRGKLQGSRCSIAISHIRRIFIKYCVQIGAILAVIPLLLLAITMATAFRNPEEGTKLATASTKFAWKLFKQLTTEKPGENIFLSPASINLALGMTYVGAKGNTAAQMKDTMFFNEVSDDKLHSSFEDLQGSLMNTGGNYTLHIANKLFGEQSYKFMDEFKSITSAHYKAELAPVNFATQADAARVQINNWVAEQTKDKIKDLMAAGSLDSLTRLLLVNAIYFKGNWTHKFDTAKTKEGDFKITPDNIIKVQMMYQHRHFNAGFHQALNMQILELPYVGDKMSMLLIQSFDQSPAGLQKVEEGLTDEQLDDPHKAFRIRDIDCHVTLPRFKLDQSFDLEKTLPSLGMRDIFKEGTADLSGIDGTRNLFVSKVVHKAFLEVNEEGSEAAAATAVKAQLRMLPKYKEFVFDRPFLLMIRDNVTKSIVFMGRVANPGTGGSGKDEL